MKSILIVGGDGTLVDALNQKIARENVRITILSREKKKTTLRHVHFYAYDSDSVREVMDSCAPDTVLFLGAHDPSFHWTNRSQNSDYKEYMAGLVNLLHCSASAGVQRFVYLSSECVYAENYLTPIPEDVPVSPRGVMASAVSLGEQTALSFGEQQHLDVVVLRLSQLYMVPKNGQECRDPYTKLCLEAVTSGQLHINTKIVRSALHLNDAVQAIFQVMSVTMHECRLYHVAAKEKITEDMVVQMIQKASARQITILDHTIGLEHCEQLSGSRFDAEFDFSARNPLEETIPKILQKVQGRAHLYQEEHNRSERKNLTRFFHNLMPFLESFLVFCVVMAVNFLLADHEVLAHIDLFLLYVVLFAIYHGLNASIFSASLSVLGHFLLKLSGSDALSILMDISTYVWIAMIFIVGMSVGHLHDNLKQVREDKDDEISYLSNRLGDIADINQSNVAIKNYFEQQVINSDESMGFFYDIVAKLDDANENEVLFVAVQLLAKAMGTEEAAIYTVGKSGFCRLLTSTAAQHHSLGKSIRIDDYKEIVTTLKKEYVYINRTADTDQPQMASVLVNDEGGMEALIFLWDLPYERMTLHYSNMLRILTLLIRSAVERATHYLSVLTSTRYWHSTRVLQASAFRDIFQVYDNAASKRLTEYTILRIEEVPVDMAEPSGEEYDREVQAATRLSRFFRQEDYVGYLEDGRFYVLLTNTSREEATTVLHRLDAQGIRAAVIPRL